jgi:hypothetical protein
MELTAKNLGKECIYRYIYFGKNGQELREQKCKIKALLVDINEGAYGYEITWDDGNSKMGCNFIDKSLYFINNLIGYDLSELIDLTIIN